MSSEEENDSSSVADNNSLAVQPHMVCKPRRSASLMPRYAGKNRLGRSRFVGRWWGHLGRDRSLKIEKAR